MIMPCTVDAFLCLAGEVICCDGAFLECSRTVFFHSVCREIDMGIQCAHDVGTSMVSVIRKGCKYKEEKIINQWCGVTKCTYIGGAVWTHPSLLE
jgi:hypothetical protein